MQVGRSRLANAVERDQLAARSIAVLPFLDLDAVQADSSLARSLAAGLGSKLLALGTVRVISETDGVAANPGAGTLADLRAIGQGTGVRTAMIGTIRQLGNKRRISFRLLDVNTGETLLARTVSINTATPPALEMAHVYAKELFSMLAGARLEGAPVDPVMGDSAAHEFLRAGDELATHRTVVDIDRAITCYSRAIELQPKSAIARASFVLAAVGRLGLGYPDMELLRKAEVYGREAVALNGGSSFSHRALESLLLLQGKLMEAREEALRAIEAGDLLRGSGGAALLDKMRGRPDLALRWRAVSSHWQSRPANEEFITGDCWADLVDDDRAAASYRRVTDLYPDIPEGWIGLCRLKLLEGDFAAARKIYRENIDSYREYGFARQMAAQVEFFARNFDEADKLYTDLSREEPNGGGSYFACVSFQSALGPFALSRRR